VRRHSVLALASLARTRGVRRQLRLTASLAAESSACQWDASMAGAVARRRATALRSAAQETPYYRDRLPAELSAESVRDCPVISRNALLSHFSSFVRPGVGPVDVTYTTGTSGERTRSVRPVSAARDRGAIERRLYESAHVPGFCQVTCVTSWPGEGPRHVNFNDWKISYVEMGFRDALDRAARDRGLGDIIVAQPDVLIGLCRRLTCWPNVRMLLSSFEVLSRRDRQTISDCPSSPPLGETYVAADVSVPMAQAYVGCSAMHVVTDGVYVEVLAADGTGVPDGIAGSIVVTDLVNTAMPLIRYAVGDVGVLYPADACSCGRPAPVLRVMGRHQTADRASAATKALLTAAASGLTRPFAVLDLVGELSLHADAHEDDQRLAELRSKIGSGLPVTKDDTLTRHLRRPGGNLVTATCRYPLDDYLDGPPPAGWRPHPGTESAKCDRPGAARTTPDRPSPRSVARRVLRDLNAARGGIGEIRVLDSGSMYPTFSAEMMLRVRWGIPPSRDVRGRILMSEVDNGLMVAHRGVAERIGAAGREILQIGDRYRPGHPHAGFWVSADDILGIVESAASIDGAHLRLRYRGTRSWPDRLIALCSHAVWRLDRSQLRISVWPALVVQRVVVRAVALWRRSQLGRRITQLSLPVSAGQQ
jgi:hypothetical protein